MKKSKNSGDKKKTVVHGVEMTEEEARRYESAVMEFRELVASIASEYSEFVLTPRILADKRRREGDPHASPADYDCLCELSPKDGLPICEERRANCKFSDRKPPPGIRYRDNTLKHAILRAEQRKILSALTKEEPEAVLAALERMDRAIEKALRRIEALRGVKIERSTTGWL